MFKLLTTLIYAHFEDFFFYLFMALFIFLVLIYCLENYKCKLNFTGGFKRITTILVKSIQQKILVEITKNL